MSRTEEEQTAVAMAMLDGMADLWFAESGFAVLNFPEPVVRMIKQAHLEGLYAGRCSNVDETIEKCANVAWHNEPYGIISNMILALKKS